MHGMQENLGDIESVLYLEVFPLFGGNTVSMRESQVSIIERCPLSEVWDEANKRAIELAQEPGCELIHPFDRPDIWEGHASIVEEIALPYLEHRKPHPFRKPV